MQSHSTAPSLFSKQNSPKILKIRFQINRANHREGLKNAILRGGINQVRYVYSVHAPRNMFHLQELRQLVTTDQSLTQRIVEVADAYIHLTFPHSNQHTTPPCMALQHSN